MAKTTIQGPGGNVAITDRVASTAVYDAKLSMWAADIQVHTVETTGFDDVGFETHEPVLISASGSCKGIGQSASGVKLIPSTATSSAQTGVILTSTNTADTAVYDFGGSKVHLVLSLDSTRSYEMDAIVSAVNIDRANDGAEEVTFNFVSDGQISAVGWA